MDLSTRPTYSPTRPTDSSKRKEKAHVPADPESDPSSSDSPSNETDLSDDKITVNQTKRNAIQRKSVGNTRNETCQTHRQAILILLKTVTPDASGVKRRGIGVDMANLATKTSSRDDVLVARLSISKNMLHKPDLSAARSSTIVCPRTWVTTPKVLPGN